MNYIHRKSTDLLSLRANMGQMCDFIATKPMGKEFKNRHNFLYSKHEIFWGWGIFFVLKWSLNFHLDYVISFSVVQRLKTKSRIWRQAHVCVFQRERLKTKRCLGHHLVIFGFISHPVTHIALVLTYTELKLCDLLELGSPSVALEEWNGKT